jgi:RNA polymerase sigma-70 factor (ECF subfamily)
VATVGHFAPGMGVFAVFGLGGRCTGCVGCLTNWESMASEEDWGARLISLMPQALAMAVRLCGQLEVAEEAVQEAMVSIQKAQQDRGAAAYKGEAAFSTWVMQVVLNRCRDQVRRRRRRSSEQFLLGTPAVANGPSGDSTLQGSAQANWEAVPCPRTKDPVTGLLDQERQAALRDAIWRLPDRQREVVQLLVWDGRSAEEVSRLLGVSTQNVYSNFHIAKQALRLALEGNDPQQLSGPGGVR